jgi:predicted transcriptional regulator
MSVGEICSRQVATIDSRSDLIEAAQAMREEHVGDLVVVEEHDGALRPVGIITDRDIVLEAVAMEVDPGRIRVADAMSPKPYTVRDDQGIHYALQQMSHEGVRRAPVVDAQGHLCGVLSINDAIAYVAEMLHEIAGAIQSGVANERDTRP